MALLEVRNLTISFPTVAGDFYAVQGIDLSVDVGEVLAVVGESGSGKSVAMLAVMGLLPPFATVTADAMTFEGRDLLALSPRQRDGQIADGKQRRALGGGVVHGFRLHVCAVED